MIRSKVVLSSLLLLSVIGCSNKDDGGSNPAPTGVNLEGKVSDPAIKNAKVMIVDTDGNSVYKCGTSASLECIEWTDNNGKFSFHIDKNIDKSALAIKTLGGIDVKYGTSINSSFFKNMNNGELIVTPITTLTYQYSKNKGVPIDEAETIVANYFDIDKSLLNKDPEHNPQLLNRTYIINKIINDSKNPDFNNLTNLINSSSNFNSDISNVLNTIYPGNSNENKSIKENLISLNTFLGQENSSNPDTMIENIKIFELKKLVVEIFSKKLTGSVNGSDLDNPAQIITNKILEKNLDVPLKNYNVSNLIGFLISVEPRLKDVNFLKGTSLQTTIDTIFNNNIEKIKSLLKLNVYSTDIAIDEPLDKDLTSVLEKSKARANYYFSSTEDINYKALDIVKDIQNDTILDNVYEKIADRYSKYGQHNKAVSYAEINIANTNILNRTLVNIAKNIYKYDKQAAISYTKDIQKRIDNYYEQHKNNAGQLSFLLTYYTDLISIYINMEDFPNIESNLKRVLTLLEKKETNFQDYMSYIMPVFMEYKNKINAYNKYDSSPENLAKAEKLLDSWYGIIKNNINYSKYKSPKPMGPGVIDELEINDTYSMYKIQNLSDIYELSCFLYKKNNTAKTKSILDTSLSSLNNELAAAQKADIDTFKYDLYSELAKTKCNILNGKISEVETLLSTYKSENAKAFENADQGKGFYPQFYEGIAYELFYHKLKTSKAAKIYVEAENFLNGYNKTYYTPKYFGNANYTGTVGIYQSAFNRALNDEKDYVLTLKIIDRFLERFNEFLTAQIGKNGGKELVLNNLFWNSFIERFGIAYEEIGRASCRERV